MTNKKDDNPYWKLAELTEDQRAKCLLLDLVIYQSRQTERFIVCLESKGNQYVRPIMGSPQYSQNRSHVEVKTFEECIDMCANPEKYGGYWG